VVLSVVATLEEGHKQVPLTMQGNNDLINFKIAMMCH
jgi:hypothetical protein